MPISALPEKMKDLSFWDGTDNASWLMKLKKRIQYVFAAGPRVPSGFWKWRELPKTIICFSGEGDLRYETSDGTKYGNDWAIFYDKSYPHYVEGYLSRIQPWCRWHLSLCWPLFLSMHFIYKENNVVSYPKYKSDFGIKKMFTFYIGWKRDSDIVYFPTIYAGGNFE